jgi:hypothetical protein
LHGARVAPLLAASTDIAIAQSSAKSHNPDTAAFDKSLAQFQEQMKTMQAQMDQIRKTQRIASFRTARGQAGLAD